MKRLFFCFTIGLVTILFSSCGGGGPEYANDRDLKSWIYRNVVGIGKTKDNFLSLVADGAIDVPGFETYGGLSGESPRSLSEACLIFFKDNLHFFSLSKEVSPDCQEVFNPVITYIGLMGSVVEIRKVHHPSGSQYWEYLNDWDELQNSDFDFIRCDGANPWDEDAGMRQAKFLRSNPQKAKEIIMNLCKAYYAYVEDYADETVRVLNWDYNLDGVADSYTSYLVEYEVGEGNYALLDLTEFDKDERFEWELLYDGNSLTEMHDYYE